MRTIDKSTLAWFTEKLTTTNVHDTDWLLSQRLVKISYKLFTSASAYVIPKFYEET